MKLTTSEKAVSILSQNTDVFIVQSLGSSEKVVWLWLETYGYFFLLETLFNSEKWFTANKNKIKKY
jgi:hypothetical protein